MRIQRLVCASTALAFASACTGGTMQMLPNGPGKAGVARVAATTQRKPAKLEMRLKIPHRHRHARYVSTSTKSISISEGKTKLGTFDTTPSSGKCKNVNGGTLCTFDVGIVSGKNQTFTVKTYDRTGGKGNLLSTGKVTKAIVAGINVIPITLDGVVHSIAVAVQDPASPAGTSAALDVNVMANDADGNTIVGPGKYSSAITLSDSDKNGATTLSATTVTGPNDNVTLAYTGKSLTSATIGASASGVAAANVTAGTFQPTPVVLKSLQLPIGIGTNTTLPLAPEAIVNGPDGKIWFSVVAPSGSPASGVFKMTPGGPVPSSAFLIGGVTTNLPDEEILQLVVGPDGNVWYVTQDNFGKITPSGTVTNIALATRTECATSRNILGIGPATDGGLWITANCQPENTAVLIHTTTNFSIVVNSLGTAVGSPQRPLLGKDGKIYVAAYDNGSSKAAMFQITVSGASVTGTPAVLDIPALGTNTPQGLAQTTDGDLWETSGAQYPSTISRVHLASTFSASTVTTYPTLAGYAQPYYPLALPDGSLWVPEDAYPEVLQVIPAPNAGVPSLFAVAAPTPTGVYGEMRDAAIGSDGNLYFTDFDYNSYTSPFTSGNLVEVAY